jgi:hypothetical protein
MKLNLPNDTHLSNLSRYSHHYNNEQKFAYLSSFSISISIRMKAALIVGNILLMAYYRLLPLSSISVRSFLAPLKTTPYEPKPQLLIRLLTSSDLSLDFEFVPKLLEMAGLSLRLFRLLFPVKVIRIILTLKQTVF